MSRYHENVVWQSPNGTWNRGFHPISHHECGMSDDCENAPEHDWCAEFDHNAFEWVSGGHATEAQAVESWDGVNPGGHNSYAYDPNDKDSRNQVAHFEDMAAVLCEQAQQKARESNGRGAIYSGGRSWGAVYSNAPGYWGYHGPARRRSLAAIARQRNALEKSAYSHKLGLYADLPDERIKPLSDQIVERLKSATDEEKRQYLAIQQRRIDGLQQMLDKHRENRAEQARYSFGYSYNPDAARRQRALDEAEAEVETWIGKVRAARAKQETDFFPPAPEPKKPSPAKKTTAKAPAKKAAAKKTPAPKKPSPAKPAKKATAKAPAKKAPAPVAPTSRGKTTAKSNAGSFKAHTTAEATGIDLTDPWADIPQH